MTNGVGNLGLWQMLGSNRTRTVNVSITFDTSVASAVQIRGRGRMGKCFKCWSMVKGIKHCL